MTSTPSRGRLRLLVALSMFVPVALAGIGLWSLQPNSVNQNTGQPNLNAAIVNEDKMVTVEQQGQQVPIAAGRLLVGELVNSDTDGFDWTLTNEATAQAGLQSGKYSAVLTIPADFSKAYISASTDAPQQATVNIATDGAHSYVATVLARTMATTLTAQLSQQFTQQYINALLSGYSTLGTQLGAAAAGQQQLADGLAAMNAATAPLPAASSAMASGARELANANDAMTYGLGALQGFSTANIDGVKRLAELNAQLRTELDNNDVPAAQQTLNDIDTLTALLGVGSYLIDGGVGLAKDVSGQIAHGSTLLADGAQVLADGMPTLTQGLGAASTGASAIAQGLSAAAAALPNYTGSQAQTLAKVAANPIQATITTVPELPSVQSALAAILMPIALWLGALLIVLVLRPIDQRSMYSRASNLRLVLSSAVPVIGLSAAQGAVLVIAMSIAGVSPVHHTGLFALIMTASISFALLHQGLAALAPRFTWLISIGLLTLQIVSAGVILPLSFAPSFIQFLGNVLPLSIAMRGTQALISGGSLAAFGSIAGVAVSALIGLLLLGVAVARERNVAQTAEAR